MKVEDQVISIDIAKKLKEIGVKQESLFYWIINKCGDSKVAISQQLFLTEKVSNELACYEQFVGLETELSEKYSAFTVAELDAMFPNEFIIEHQSYRHKRLRLSVTIVTTTSPLIEIDRVCSDIIEADSRAKMLIYIIENNHIKVEEINNAFIS